MNKLFSLVIFLLFTLGLNSANAAECSADWAEPKPPTLKIEGLANHTEEETAAAIASAQKAIVETGKLGTQVSDLLKNAEDNASKILDDKKEIYGNGDKKLASSCQTSIEGHAAYIWGKMADMNLYVQQASLDYANAVGSNDDKAKDDQAKDEQNKQNLLNKAFDRATKAMRIAAYTFNWVRDQNKDAKKEEDKSLFSIVKVEIRILQVLANNPDQNNIEARGSEIWNSRHNEYLLLSAVDKFPSAASLVGTPGVLFSGSSSGGTATITASFEQLGLGFGDKYKSITLSAPTTKSGNTNLATLDGFESGASFRFNNRYNKPISLTKIAIYGFAPQIGYQEHSYFENNTSTKPTKSKNYPVAMTGYAGTSLGNNMDQLLLVKFQFSKEQKDLDTKTVCSGLSVPCSTGSFGEPDKVLTRTLGVEYRYSQSNWAFAPSLNYDGVAKVTGFDIPIYVIPTAKDAKPSGLTGGIDIGFRSDTHASFSIFIGSTFDLFNTQ